MILLTLIAALLSLALTLAVVWVNPRRFTNQAFALVSLVQTAWLACVYRAMQTDLLIPPYKAEALEFWFRANAAVISFLPTSIWLLTGAIVSGRGKYRDGLISALPFFAINIGSVFLSYTQSFASADPSGLLHRGESYYIILSVALAAYAACIARTCRLLLVYKGIRRLELQFLALNTGGAALLVAMLNAAGNYYNIRAFNRASVLLVFASFALTAWAILFHHVFNAREVLSRLSRRVSFALVLSGGIYVMWRATSSMLAEPFGLLLSIGLCSPIAVWLDRRSRAFFDADGERKLSEMRRAVIDLPRTELQPEKLVRAFEVWLSIEFGSPSACLLFDRGESYESPSLALDKGRPAYDTLWDISWATPESLLRRRPTPGRKDLQEFLEATGVGLIVSVPRKSPTPSLLLALKTRANDWPYTYPEVERLQNLALLIDNLLARSRLAAQAALQVRMEHLAMMSRGLAHDLKNLVTPVSSFLIHTDGHFPADSVEAEVHAAARRSMRVMSDYLREALFFAERLEPRFEPVDLETLGATACEVVAPRADRRGIAVEMLLRYNEPVAADGILLQRMFANLLSNAIDASTAGQSVLLKAAALRPGWVRVQVSDQGCGIAPENLGRIFDPYFTTKEFGEEQRGFGLGLTICQKIVLLHRGSIAVTSKPGVGTTIVIDLPVAQNTAPLLNAPVRQPAFALRNDSDSS